jgi:transposase
MASSDPSTNTPTNLPVARRPARRQPISQDVRRRFIQYVQSNALISVSSAARTFGLPVSTGHSILGKYTKAGDASAASQRGHRPSKLDQAAKDSIAQWVDEWPDLMLKSLCELLASRHSTRVSQKTMSAALTNLGFTIKILRSISASRNSPKVVNARNTYAHTFLSSAPPDQRNIVWADETGFNLYLRRKYGRAPVGERASVVVANSRGRNISVCAAMSEEGFLHEMLRPTPYTAESFCLFLEELFSILHQMGRIGCWIILDNARFHHCAIVDACANRHGHRLVFLPAYSPMLNPIESLFGKWKTLIRTQGVSFQVDELLSKMAVARAEITVFDCLGLIRDVGQNIGLSLQDHIFE